MGRYVAGLQMAAAEAGQMPAEKAAYTLGKFWVAIVNGQMLWNGTMDAVAAAEAVMDGSFLRSLISLCSK